MSITDHWVSFRVNFGQANRYKHYIARHIDWTKKDHRLTLTDMYIQTWQRKQYAYSPFLFLFFLLLFRLGGGKLEL